MALVIIGWLLAFNNGLIFQYGKYLQGEIGDNVYCTVTPPHTINNIITISAILYEVGFASVIYFCGTTSTGIRFKKEAANGASPLNFHGIFYVKYILCIIPFKFI